MVFGIQKRARTLKAALLAASALCILVAPAAAQDTGALDEIIITATKQGETNVQTTPLAVSVVGAQEIEERGLSDIQDLVGVVPGLQVSDLSGYTQLYIRGVGSNIVFIGSDPSSTTHLDGVYLARPLAYLSNFLDVERIEALRGPQGTLYGRNAVGGNINIVSRRPSEVFEGRLQATIGDYNHLGLAGYVSGPITEGGVLGSFAFNRSTHDGYLDNVAGADLEDEDFWGVRGQVLIPIGARSDLTIRADYSESDSALGQYPKLLLPTGLPLEDSILGDYHTVAHNDVNNTRARIGGLAAEFNSDISNNLHFRSLSAYRSFSGSIEADADSSSLQILRNLISPIRQEQVSQEFNLTGQYDRFNFVLGAYYFREHNEEPLTLAITPAGASHIQRPHLSAESVALFAQGEYFITDALSVVAGLRWTQEEKDYRLTDYWTASASYDPNVSANAPIIGVPFFSDPFTVDDSSDYDALTPKFGINYRLDNMLLYASATRGFKSGGYDYGSNNPIDAANGYDPEYLWAYELGAKTSWFQDRLRANVTAFYYDYTDMQVQSFRNFGALTQNAGTSEVQGLELELSARPTSNLDLYANIAYLDATYQDYEGAFTNTLGTFSADGKRLNNAPEWAVTAGGRYTWDIGSYGEMFVGADVRYQDKVYFTAANNGVNGVTNYPQQQDAYTVLDARLGWTAPGGDWDATLIGSNLTDEEYITGTADYTLVIAGRPGAPRTVRLQLSRSF
ncbi:MAG: TonB-dependent receptor [Hyphomonadaceae bacterium]|nr:TonB-dependent receptor [Hyphomonadaceae bacterium]